MMSNSQHEFKTENHSKSEYETESEAEIAVMSDKKFLTRMKYR